MHLVNDISSVAAAIRSASVLTEATFVPIGETLETSLQILASLTERFEVVLSALDGQGTRQALTALSGTASGLAKPGGAGSDDNARFDQLLARSETIANRVTQMTNSLENVNVLAINAKIAAAHIQVAGIDFSGFADEIRRTLAVARLSLTGFSADLRGVHQHLTAARTRQRAFDGQQAEAARSITQRLTATVEAITRQNQRATQATMEVRQRSAQVHKRISSAVLALQIGDITRQRLEHADQALGLLTAAREPDAGSGLPPLDDEDQRAFAILTHRLQSAHCSDAASALDRDVTRIAELLNSLAEEARALWTLGGAAYGAAGRDGGTAIVTLEGQVSEVLALFERFESARAEFAHVTATVSEAAAALRDHLRKVQDLESDIRIMGLNTTFKCARIGRDGLALSLIAQELRTYATGFAKEAAGLADDVEAIASMSGALVGGTGIDGVGLVTADMPDIKDSAFILRDVGKMLGDALAELERDSGRVVTLLEATVADLAVRDAIRRALRETADALAATVPDGDVDLDGLSPAVQRLLALVERGYTMASERTVHEKILGRALAAPPAAEPEMEDVLF